MKRILSLIFLFAATLAFVGCSDDEEEPRGLTAETIVGLWSINESTVRVQEFDLPSLYTLAGVPVAARPDWSTFRIRFNADGTYEISNISLIGIEDGGTYEVTGPDRIVLQPGRIEVTVTNFSQNSMDLAYSFSTAGTPYTALGASAPVRGTFVKVE